MLVPVSKIKYHHLKTISQVENLEKHMLKKVSKFGIDTETTGEDKLQRVHVMYMNIFGVSIYFPYHAIWIEQLHKKNKFTKRVYDFLRRILEDEDKIKILHNAPFDYNAFYKHKIEMVLPIRDTQAMANLYDENDLRGGLAKYKISSKEKGLPLKPLVWKYLGWKYDVLDFGNKDISEYPQKKRIAYGCNDSIACYYLSNFYYPRLKEQGLLPVLKKVEMPLAPAIAHMQRTGINVDVDYLTKVKPQVENDLTDIERKVQKIAGREFNLRSTQQLAEVLYKKLKLPVKKQTSGGKDGKNKKPSTNTEALELIQQEKPHPILDEILFYRKVEQIRKMYLKPFVEKHMMPDGKIYPQFPASLTVTGRMSSNNPNFQNLKKEMKDPSHPLYPYAFMVKHSVMAPEGFDIVCADYSQLEYRLLAHCSGDEKLIDGYNSGDLDIHILVASQMFDIPYDDITKDERQKGKGLNFGVVYGKGDKALAIDLKCSVEEARIKIKEYFARFPDVEEFVSKTKREAIRRGYVTTITGRRRRLPEVYSSNKYVKSAALRQAVNSVIQGSATGDINKMAIVALYENLVDNNKVFLPLDVHDELFLYVHKSITKKVAKKMKRLMENVYELKVPLIADVEVKSRWVEEKRVAA